ILRSRDADAYSCINSKRVDLLLVDEDCEPRHAIEYQGWAHHQGTAAARDAVKKEALRRAGIGYHEVVAGHTTPSELRRLVERLVTTRRARLREAVVRRGPRKETTKIMPHRRHDCGAIRPKRHAEARHGLLWQSDRFPR